MHVRVLFVPVIALGLAACGGRPGGLQDAMSYDIRSVTQVPMGDDTYRVFEHPQRDRLMTTTSIGKAFGQGFVKGATFGLADVQTPEQRHEAAARKHLDRTGRAHCTIDNGYELLNTQYEFRFTCPPQTAEQTPEADKPA
jgi:hypothetical protein